MKDRMYIALVTILSIVSLFLWVLVVIFVSPEELGWISVFLFLASIGAFFFTGSLLLLYHIRIRLLKLTPAFRQVHISFRESALISALGTLTLLIAHFSFLSAINFFL